MTYLTDLTTNAFRHSSKWRLQLPQLAIGRIISKIPTVIVRAFTMAYVAPLCTLQSQPLIETDEDLDGRDSCW